MKMKLGDEDPVETDILIRLLLDPHAPEHAVLRFKVSKMLEEDCVGQRWIAESAILLGLHKPKDEIQDSQPQKITSSRRRFTKRRPRSVKPQCQRPPKVELAD